MIMICNSKTNKKRHNTIAKILHKALLPYEYILPDFKIIIYDRCIGCNTQKSTGIYYTKNEIDFNIRQLFDLYNNPDDLCRDKKEHIKLLKTFRQYLIFALYHELGHYKSKDYFNNKYNNDKIEQLRADYFSLRILKKLKVIK